MSSKGSYKHPNFKWHLPSAVPFSTVANALVCTFFDYHSGGGTEMQLFSFTVI